MPRNFTDFIDSYLAFAEGQESTAKIRTWSAISIIAGAMERKTYLLRGQYTLFPNLYIFIIGKSGLIKKSTSTGIAVNLLREIKGVKIMSDRLTASSLIHQIVKSKKKYEKHGNTFTQSALFAYASELSVFMEEVFGDITPLLTTFYDCIPHDSSKPWVYHTRGRDTEEIYGSCLNLLGASTRSWLTRCIPKSEMEGGFTSRIVFVVENNPPDRLIAWPELNENDELTRMKLVQDLKAINELIGKFHVEQEAKEFYTKWYEYHNREVLPRNQNPKMIGYMSRKGDTILKVAMIKSSSRSDELQISKSDIEWALTQIDSLEADWQSAFEGYGSVPQGLAQEICNFIHVRGKVTKTETFDTFNKLHPQPKVLKAISDLKGMDEIEDYVETKGNIKTEFYVLPGHDELSLRDRPR